MGSVVAVITAAMSSTTGNFSQVYALIGFFLGISAPLGWMVLRLLLFADANQPLSSQLFSEMTQSAQGMALYAYMGGGTACVLAVFGYFIGRAIDELHLKRERLDQRSELLKARRCQGNSAISTSEQSVGCLLI